mgnify:FL=1
MPSAKQIKARKEFAKRVKRGDFRKAISKTKKSKSNPKEKNSSRAKLEQRIADLEEKFHQKLKHYDDYDSRELDFDGDQIRKTRIKLSDELKKEMKY